MKKSILFKSFLLIGLAITGALPGFAQNWLLSGNAFTNPPTDFLGTTDNVPLIFKTNNQQRVSITTWGGYGGLEAGTTGLPGYISILSRDIVDTMLPLSISCGRIGQTWGNSPGQTMGRLIRLNQGPSTALGGQNWYDVGIGEDTCFFITNHSIPPVFGNGVIRKRMIVISPQDMVGINLQSNDAIGTGAVPTANFHTNGTVRFENLPSGSGNILVIDKNGDVYASSSSARESSAGNEQLQSEVESLKKEVEALKSMIKTMKEGMVRLSTAEEVTLFQNAPNPFNKATVIKYLVPASAEQAYLNVTDMHGKRVKTFNISGKSNQPVVITEGALAAGTYFYSLVVDGKTIDTKKMVLTR
jgi:hypothetical protein